MANFTPAPEIKEIADELIPLHHKHLIEHRVRMVYRFSDQESQAHNRNRYGQAVKISGLTASLSDEDDIDRQFDKFTFVCVKCLNWKTDGEKATTEINGEDYTFCDECREQLDNAKVSEPDESFIAWVKGRQEKADITAEGGPATSPGMWALVIYEHIWRNADTDTRAALVDSLLEYCGSYVSQSGDIKLTKKPADIITHTGILERHGTAWNGFLEKAANIIKGSPQLSMSYADDDEDTAEDTLLRTAGELRERGLSSLTPDDNQEAA